MPSPDDTFDSAATSTSGAAPILVPTGPFANIWFRGVVSLLLVYHFAAVLIEPLAIPPRFAGERPMLPNAVRPAFQPYMTALALEQGYRFFAPDPGDSHLIRYDLYFADGRKMVGDAENVFPNRRRDWPRLLYHRYFMLAEHLPKDRTFADWNLTSPPEGERVPPTASIVPPGSEFVPPVAEEISPAINGPRSAKGAAPDDPRSPLERLRSEYVAGFAKYLVKKHGAERVDVFHVVHRLSHPDEIIAGRKLDEPDTKRERLLLSYKFIVPQAGPKNDAATKAAPASEAAR